MFNNNLEISTRKNYAILIFFITFGKKMLNHRTSPRFHQKVFQVQTKVFFKILTSACTLALAQVVK